MNNTKDTQNAQNMDKMKKEKKEFIEKKDNGIYFKEIVTYLSNNECDNIININKEIDDIIIELITIDLYNEIENLVNEYSEIKVKMVIILETYHL